MASVWVQYEGNALLFLLRNDRLVLSSISTRWSLDPSTIQVGDLALTADADGNSIYTLEEIRAFSTAAGLGDGLTKKSAFVISGKLSTPREEIEKVCSEYWNSIVRVLPSMPGENDFKSPYSRSKTALCTLSQRVTLLLQGLREGEYLSSSSRVLKHFDATELMFLVDASGSGKTRTLFEMACQTDLIYLAGVSDSRVGSEGSRDLTEVSTKLATLYPSGPIPEDALVSCLCALLIARFFLHKQAGSITRLAWLFKQVYFEHLKYPGGDPWLELTKRIFKLFPTAKLMEASSVVLKKILYELQTEANWNGIVVIDECQELSKLLKNRFLSETRNEVNRSMLDLLLVSFRQLGCGRMIVSGTGKHMIRLINSLSESAKNRLSYGVYTEFGEFSSPDSLRQFTVKYVDHVDDFDFERIFELFRGRYRLFVTALEMFLKESHGKAIVATEFFLKTWDQLSREPAVHQQVCVG